MEESYLLLFNYVLLRGISVWFHLYHFTHILISLYNLYQNLESWTIFGVFQREEDYLFKLQNSIYLLV